MSITLYTAPDCLRCKIVKGFLAEHQIAYETVDFKADAQTFNTFYRANRKAIYRNPEGVEFRCSTTARSSSRAPEVIAYLLSGTPSKARSRAATCCTAGFPASTFPSARRRRKITSSNWCNSRQGRPHGLHTDGRTESRPARTPHRPERAGQVQLNIGPASVYEALYGSAPTKDELAKTIELVKAFPDHEIRFLATPLSGPRAHVGRTATKPVKRPAWSLKPAAIISFPTPSPP
ncbi:MAG: hypothetical protein ACLRWP_02295 [Bilophila wadsworthia]